MPLLTVYNISIYVTTPTAQADGLLVLQREMARGRCHFDRFMSTNLQNYVSRFARRQARTSASAVASDCSA